MQARSSPMPPSQETLKSSALYVQQGSDVFSRSYGLTHDTDAMFLLASISKTIAVASVLTLLDEGHFRLDENFQRYLPEFQVKVHHT
jgi:CubicO group peptidase (beta-lactamase class C family)